MSALELIVLIFQAAVLLYFVALNGTYTVFLLLSLKEIKKYFYFVTRHDIRALLSGNYYRPLSIIVPAYNEEATIVTNVRALLSLEYPEYEVIVVNDGSTDKELEKLIESFRLVEIEKPIRLVLKHKPIRKAYVSLDHPNLVVLDKENGGKTDALNAGINTSSFPLFCSIDADSILDKEGLLRTGRLFVEDKRVIAVGGIVRVLNGLEVEKGEISHIHAPHKAIELFQAVEYTRGFLSGRTSWNLFSSLLILSGTYAVFRKDMVVAVGGYRNTVGEDMDLVVRLHKHCRDNDIPYKVLFVPDPVCHTQVPGDVKSLLQQRSRWHRGLIQSLSYSKEMFLRRRYGSVGMFGFPYFLFVEGLGPAVEFMGYASLVPLYFLGLLNWQFLFLFFLVAVLWAMWINIGSIMLDNILYKRYKRLRDILKLCVFGFFEMCGYRQLIAADRFVATLGFRRGTWGHPRRQRIEYAPLKKRVSYGQIHIDLKM
jgi:cellulose synthase/poly-beta-1,6-N-acetylglucosamine synthase-like glycosyltransferase